MRNRLFDKDWFELQKQKYRCPSQSEFDDLINKFSSIPDEHWVTDSLNDPGDDVRRCAIDHCYIYTGDTHFKDTKESDWLTWLHHSAPTPPGRNYWLLHMSVNDGDDIYKDWATYHNFPIEQTPKARIIQWLKWLKEEFKGKE
jgi:hypothetical protein